MAALPSPYPHPLFSPADRKIIWPRDNKALAIANESGQRRVGRPAGQWAARMFPGDPPKHTQRAAMAKPQASQTWLHPRNAKMHTHMRPRTGRGWARPSQPQNSLGHSACHSSPAWHHSHQLLCSSKPQGVVAGARPHSQAGEGREAQGGEAGSPGSSG